MHHFTLGIGSIRVSSDKPISKRYGTHTQIATENYLLLYRFDICNLSQLQQ